MARKEYNGAKVSIFVAAAGAVLLGSAWLANQPATVTQAASGAVTSVAVPSGAIPSGVNSSTLSSAPAATATSAPRPVLRATRSRGS